MSATAAAISSMSKKQIFFLRLTWTLFCLAVAFVPVILLWDVFNTWGFGWSFLFGCLLGNVAGWTCLLVWEIYLMPRGL